jgi:hypothetical protein
MCVERDVIATRAQTSSAPSVTAARAEATRARRSMYVAAANEAARGSTSAITAGVAGGASGLSASPMRPVIGTPTSGAGGDDVRKYTLDSATSAFGVLCTLGEHKDFVRALVLTPTALFTASADKASCAHLHA